MLKVKYGVADEDMVLWDKMFYWQILQKMAVYAIAPYGIKEQFLYAVIRGEKLIFYFYHQGARQEFRMRFEGIKQHLRVAFKAHIKECRRYDISFKDIDCALSLRIIDKQSHLAQKSLKPQIYKERSTGDFSYNKDSILAQSFERLSQAIKERIAQENLQDSKEV